MYRLALSLKARGLPVAAGVVVAFGSIWVTCKDHLYYNNSCSSLLWQYFVPSFLKTNSSPNIPERHTSPRASRKLPHVEIRKNEKLVPVNFGVVSHYESNNLPSNDPMEDRNAEYRISDGLLFGVFDGHSGWQCAEEVMNRLPYYFALSSASKRDTGNPDKIFSGVDRLGEISIARKSTKDILGPKAGDFFKNVNFENESVEQKLRTAYRLLDDDIVYEALPEVNGYDHEKIMKGLSGACAISAYVQREDLYVASSGERPACTCFFFATLSLCVPKCALCKWLSKGLFSWR